MIYGLFLTIVRKSPNARYILGVKESDSEKYYAQMMNLALYSFIEICSLTLLGILAWARYRLQLHHLLLETLTRNYTFAFSLSCLWILCALSPRMEHFGYDFTSKFQWLTPDTSN